MGLRLSAAATATLNTETYLERLGAELADNGLHIETINAFPFGPFHGVPVKEQVYRPDWSEPERPAYTKAVAKLLDDLHQGAGHPRPISISTVPGGFRFRQEVSQQPQVIAARLREIAKDFWQRQQSNGLTLRLAIEPEPACLFETTQELMVFLDRELFSRTSVHAFAQPLGLTSAEGEIVLRNHIGICLDTCHAAVEFETPTETLRAIQGAGVGLYKVQVSNGLRLNVENTADLQRLVPFAEGTYLHQVVVKEPQPAMLDQTLRRFVDLPNAFELAKSGDIKIPSEWRIHCHVPVFVSHFPDASFGALDSTQAYISGIFDLLKDAPEQLPKAPCFEVETYTWDVLPQAVRSQSVETDIVRELLWTRKSMGALLSPDGLWAKHMIEQDVFDIFGRHGLCKGRPSDVMRLG